MSSSRSIAAARNRRAGDSSSSSSQQQSRPNTSIGSSAVFSQQQQSGGMKNGRQQAPPPPQLQRSQGQRASQMQPAQQQAAIPARPKISVSDAIGLTTLRLGKVEQFIMDFMESGGMETVGAGVGGIPENTKLVDNSVLTSIINRLDALEKKEMSMMETIAKLEKANTELTSKLDASILDTNGRISDIDAAFADLEAKVFEGDGEGEGEKQDNVEEEGQGQVQTDTLAGEDLKNMVQQELQGE